jgi:hypothetical protein
MALVALLSACAPKADGTATSTAVATGLRPVASVLDLMLGQIDPAADFLWESVATISSPTGVEERQPRTDREWAEVRYKALAISEGANLLAMEGRRVALPGQKLEEPGGPTDFTPEQAQAAIDADRATFVSFARALQDSAGLALAAIEKRDVEAYLEAGGALDEACEQCHKRFWYPGSPAPPGS